MIRRHYMLGFTSFLVGYQSVIKLWVRVGNGVRVGLAFRVRVRVWVRFRAKVRAFSNAKLRIFSQGKMMSCHFGVWKQVATVRAWERVKFCN